MKKKALNKDLRREIKHTRSRFLSIFLLVTLAVAFLSGLRTTAPDMKKTADVYLDAQNLMDLRVVSTLGLTDEDVEALAARDEVEQAEGAWSLDALADQATADVAVTVLSLGEDINRPYLLEGRLPEKVGECVTEANLLSALNKSIGDTITLNTADGDELAETTYTIVGTVNSPLYISFQRGSSSLGSGKVTAFVIVPDETFTLDYYTDCYLTVKGAMALNPFEDEYEDLISDVQDSMESFADERAALRSDTLRDDAQEELDEARAEYEDKKAEAEQELADAQAELDEARQELDDGWQELEDSKNTLSTETADAEQEIADGEAELKDAYNTLVSGESQYKSGKSQLASAQTQYESGLAEYESGLAEYNEGYAQYESGLEQYEAGLAQYQSGLEQYEAGLAQWESAWAQITAAGLEDSETGLALQAQKTQLDTTKATLDATKEQLDTSKATLDATKEQLDAAKSTLDSSKAQLDAAAKQIASSQATLSASRKELDSGWSDYYSGQSEIADAKEELSSSTAEAEQKIADAEQELNDGETEYADGLADYTEAKAEADEELADAQQKLDDAQDEIDDIEDCTWYVLGRSTNLGFAGYRQDAEHMGKLGEVFPLIFFLVAALVCLTTMTRMVEDQRVQIGCLKALGYSRLDISRKYLGYGLLASVGGSVCGLALGCTSFPLVIITCWKIMYVIPGLEFAVCPAIYIFSAAAAVGVIVVAVLSATLNALRATPASLMRPKTPKAGKRVLLEHITPLWHHLSFSKKVTVRNLFRYQKRFWMTVIGIGGCTALLVAGFGLKDSIMDILGIQYDELHTYHITVSLEQEEEENLISTLEEEQEKGLAESWLICTEGGMDFEANGQAASGYYMVLDGDQDSSEFLHLRTRKGHETVPLTDDGVVITEKLAELLEVEVGDSITLDGDEKVSATVTGIAENYVYHYVYLTQSCYESLYGESSEHNTAFVRLYEDTDENNEAVRSALLEADCVTAVSGIRAARDNIQSSFDTINYAVLIIIVSAAALAFVVLYNLTNINLTERMRELATLKVLGFRDREMNAYVFRENVILTILGDGVGLLLGKALHQYLIRSVEVESVEFGRSVSLRSYLFSFALTLIFGLLVNQVSKRKLRKIDMVESLKTVE